MWPWRKQAEPPAIGTGPADSTTTGNTAGNSADSGRPAGSGEQSVVRRPRADWQLVAPIQRVVGDPPLINPVQRFSGSLAAWRDPSFLAPLAHALHPEEPSGVITDLATPHADPSAGHLHGGDVAMPLATPASPPKRPAGAAVQRSAIASAGPAATPASSIARAESPSSATSSSETSSAEGSGPSSVDTSHVESSGSATSGSATSSSVTPSAPTVGADHVDSTPVAQRVDQSGFAPLTGVGPLPVFTLPAVASAGTAATPSSAPLPLIQRVTDAPAAGARPAAGGSAAANSTPLLGTPESPAPSTPPAAAAPEPPAAQPRRRLGLGEPIVGGMPLQRLSTGPDATPTPAAGPALGDGHFGVDGHFEGDGHVHDTVQRTPDDHAATPPSAPLLGDQPLATGPDTFDTAGGDTAGTSTAGGAHPAGLPLIAPDVVNALPTLPLATSSAGSAPGQTSGGRAASPVVARLIGDRPSLLGGNEGGASGGGAQAGGAPLGGAGSPASHGGGSSRQPQLDAPAAPIAWVDPAAELRLGNSPAIQRLAATPARSSASNRAGGHGGGQPTGGQPTNDMATRGGPAASMVYAQRATGEPSAPGGSAMAGGYGGGNGYSGGNAFSSGGGFSGGVPMSQLPIATASWVNPAVQRAEVAAPPPVVQTVTMQREAAPAPAPVEAQAAAPAADAGGGHEAGGDAEAMVTKLFDPLLSRLKAELRLDRERRGSLTDLWH